MVFLRDVLRLRAGILIYNNDKKKKFDVYFYKKRFSSLEALFAPALDIPLSKAEASFARRLPETVLCLL